jgi:hypothetical protein
MENNLRQEILKELKIILNEEAGSGEPEEIAKNILSSDIISMFNFDKEISKSGDKVARYEKSDKQYIDATGYTDNVTKPEMDRYISVGAPNQQANDKLCKITTGIIVLDGVGAYGDQAWQVKCTNGKPVSVQAITKDKSPRSIWDAYKKYVLNSTAGVSPAPQPPTGGGGGATGGDTTPPSGDGTISSKSVRCADDSVFVYQQWLKYIHGYTNLVVDGAYGKNTHAAAKKVFNEPKDLEQVKQEVCRFARSKRAEWVEQLKSKIPADKIGKPESQSGGAASKRRKTSAAPKSPQNQQDILRAIAMADQAWMNQTGGKEFKKYVEAYNTNSEFKEKVDAQAATGKLDAAWIIKNSGLKESYNFHDKLKVNKAEIIYETLMKKWI